MTQTSPSKKKTLKYFVNGEEQTTDERKRKVSEILTAAGFTPASDYTLTRDAGHHTFDDQDELVPLHNDERFTAKFTGPTPMS